MGKSVLRPVYLLLSFAANVDTGIFAFANLIAVAERAAVVHHWLRFVAFCGNAVFAVEGAGEVRKYRFTERQYSTHIPIRSGF